MKRQQLEYNPHLDGLRALAFLLVFLYHTESNIVPFGWIGVDLFFVLSGFLITRILVKSVDNGTTLSQYLKVFFLRRILRIFPLYYLALFLFIVLLPFIAQYFQTETNYNTLSKDAVWFVTYLQNFVIGYRNEYFNPGFLNHFWTLAIEEHFYLLWPFLVFFFRKDIIKVAISTIVIVLLFRIISVINGVNPLFIHVGTFYRLDTLLFGSLLGVLIEKDFYSKVKKYSSITLKIILLTIILSACIIGSFKDYKYIQIYNYLALSILFTFLLIIINYRGNSFNFYPKEDWFILEN